MQALEAAPKPEEKYIESADVLVVAGRGVKKEEDLAMLVTNSPNRVETKPLGRKVTLHVHDIGIHTETIRQTKLLKVHEEHTNNSFNNVIKNGLLAGLPKMILKSRSVNGLM